jgi:DNA-binding NtrC family response regulator
VCLISTDPSLVEDVTGVVRSVGDLRLQVLAHLEEACAQLERGGAALVLAHLPPGDADWVTPLIRSAVASHRPVPVLVVSDGHHPAQALDLLRAGVVDYLSRPLDLPRLGNLVDLLTVRIRYEARRAQDPAVEVLGGAEGFLYVPSAQMGPLMEQVRRVAPQDTTVLLGGETGTGKTRLARLIHDLSPRRGQPFLVVNCAALSAGLLESELFGHVKGAFTGADRDRVGKFADAGRGTLLLDDIDALPLAVQAKLLRAVEDRLFESVGCNRALPLSARLIAASNRQLDREAAAGRFRPDLYYRLDVVGFHLPPLRERPEVIPALVDRYLAEFAARNGRAVRGITADALGAVCGYGWPGNIRELRNAIERAVALCAGEVIRPDDLPPGVRGSAPEEIPARPPTPPRAGAGDTLNRAREQAESLRIAEALRKHKNNRLRAAAELGISRVTLYKKLRRYGLMCCGPMTAGRAAGQQRGLAG